MSWTMYLVKCQNLQCERSCVWNKVKGLMFSHSTGLVLNAEKQCAGTCTWLELLFNYWISTLTISVCCILTKIKRRAVCSLFLSQVFTLYFIRLPNCCGAIAFCLLSLAIAYRPWWQCFLIVNHQRSDDDPSIISDHGLLIGR